jgi:uncharacterized membrane protein YcaP (DUF421 family)
MNMYWLSRQAWFGDLIVIKREEKSILKCKDFTVERQFLCNIKNNDTSINKGNQNHLNSSRNYLNNNIGNQEIKETQKTAVLAMRMYFGKY